MDLGRAEGRQSTRASAGEICQRPGDQVTGVGHVVGRVANLDGEQSVSPLFSDNW